VKKLTLFFLIGCILVLFSNTYAQIEFEVNATGGQLIFSESSKQFYGIGGRFRLATEKLLLNIDVSFLGGEQDSGIRGDQKTHSRIEARSTVWKSIVFGGSFNYRQENNDLHVFGKPNETAVREIWEEHYLVLGVGIKSGNYNNSFIETATFGGFLKYNNTKKFELIGAERQNKFWEGVYGINVIGRQRFQFLRPSWFGFRTDLKYFTARKKWRSTLEVEWGIEFGDGFALRFTGSVLKEEKYRTNYSVGLMAKF